MLYCTYTPEESFIQRDVGIGKHRVLRKTSSFPILHFCSGILDWGVLVGGCYFVGTGGLSASTWSNFWRA